MVKTLMRRKQQGKTNYKLRKGLLISGKARVVIRKTNKQIIVQYVKSVEAKDLVMFTTNSRELLKKGWPENLKGSLKSIPAAYLTGFIVGKKIIEVDKEQEVILDLGLARAISGNRLYAVLKGLVDAGVNIKHDEKIFPSNERLQGNHLKNKIEIDKIKQGL